jgi:hypothetical protein
MNKQPSSTIITRLCWGAFFLVLLFLAVQVIPPSLGQARSSGSKQSLAAAQMPQGPPPATGAVQTQPSSIRERGSAPSSAPGALAGTYGPAKPDTNLLASDQSRLVAPAAPSQATGGWTMGTPYPTAIVRYGFAQTVTHFYVFGGVDNGSTTSDVNRMNIATGVWEPRAPMPFSGEAPTCALMESTGIVYCADGSDTNSFAAYNIATDTWTPLAPDPFVFTHYGSSSGAFNGKVFVAGGPGSFSNAVDVYDVATNTWSAGTPAPNTFLLAGYHQLGQYLYVVGGWTGGETTGLTTTWRLNMSSAPGVWENGPAFPMGRADFGLAYDPGTDKLYALGGDLCCDGTFFNSTDEVDELDVGSWPGGTWVMSPPNLPEPKRQSNQAGFYGNGDIWSVGGARGTDPLLNEVWHRNNGTSTPTPTPTPGEIRLRFGAHLRDGFKVVKLNWIGATSRTVDVYRDGAVLATVNNEGSYVDVLRVRGIFTYQVCEAGTTNCSNEVTVTFSGP